MGLAAAEAVLVVMADFLQVAGAAIEAMGAIILVQVEEPAAMEEVT